MFKYTKSAEVDPEILTRITEEEVTAWIVARLDQLRTTHRVQPNTISFSASYHERRADSHYSHSWTMHAVGACTHHETIPACLRKLDEELFKDPKREIAKKRQAAQELLDEAAALERGAKEVKA